MRGLDAADSRRSFRPVALLLSLIFLIVIGVPASLLGTLYGHFDALSTHVRNGDVRASAVELDQVTGFYETSRRWGFGRLADYLLKDAVLQRAAYAYVAGDYEAVLSGLEGKIDDPRASYLLGCAKFRLVQRRYHEMTGGDARSKARRAAIVQEVMETINPDFERALRADEDDTFAYKWNYDLTSDAGAINRALETPIEPEPPIIEQGMKAKNPARLRRG